MIDLRQMLGSVAAAWVRPSREFTVLGPPDDPTPEFRRQVAEMRQRRQQLTAVLAASAESIALLQAEHDRKAAELAELSARLERIEQMRFV